MPRLVINVGAYKHIKETFEKEYVARSPIYRERLTKWGKESTVVRVEKPTNLQRARNIGYKAKQGYVVVRVRMGKGRSKRIKMRKGGKPRRRARFVSSDKSLRHMAEEKAARKYSNMEVLNSYWVGEDGNRKYFEVVLVDRSHPSVKIHMQTGRAFRGLTSAARKHRPALWS